MKAQAMSAVVGSIILLVLTACIAPNTVPLEATIAAQEQRIARMEGTAQARAATPAATVTPIPSAIDTVTPRPTTRPIPLERELRVGVDTGPPTDPYQNPLTTGVAENLSSTWDIVGLVIRVSLVDAGNIEVFWGANTPEALTKEAFVSVFLTPEELARADVIRAGDREFWSIELHTTGDWSGKRWVSWSCAAAWQWREVSSGRLSGWQSKSCVRE